MGEEGLKMKKKTEKEKRRGAAILTAKHDFRWKHLPARRSCNIN
jgi:hypothetical protein